MLLLKADEKLSDRTRDRLQVVFDVDGSTAKLKVSWQVAEQLLRLLPTGSLADAAAVESELASRLVERAGQPETDRLWRTIQRWWNEIEVMIVTGATTGK